MHKAKTKTAGEKVGTWESGTEKKGPDYRRLVHALDLVATERARQHGLLKDGAILDDCSSPETSHEASLRVLGEEFGEVCEATNQLLDFQRRNPATKDLGGRLVKRLEHLRAEYIQTAAVAVARVEALTLQLEELQP